jgi:Tol biopolymer transport system component/DNA-binding winged helix-turn-helix (wHTH) protein
MSNRANGLYEFGSFRLDAAKRLLTRAGESVTLAPKTFDLLVLLAESEGRALTKAELMQTLWPDTFVEEANLSFQMSALRKALGEEGTEWIETVPKHGYRFSAAVKRGGEEKPFGPASASVLRRRGLVPWVVAAVFGVAALTFAGMYFRSAPPPERTVRLLISPPERGQFFDFPAISPDGERLAFLGEAPDKRAPRLWVRRLDAVTAEPLADAVERGLPFWSTDSRYIVFSAGGKLLKIDVRGGPPQTVCDAPAAGLPGGAWSRNGVILFHAGFPGRAVLYRVAASGGEATAATSLDASRQEVGHYWPQFLPDGRHFLYFVRSSRPENTGIYVGSLDSKDSRRLLSTNHNAAYAGSLSGPDHVLFMQGSNLMARPFDARQLTLTGPPFPVAERIHLPPAQLSGRAAFSVSRNGVLAYGMASDTETTELVWFDRQGKRLGTVGEPADYSNPALSPDEKRLVVCRMNPQAGSRDLWLFDLVRGTSSRFTFDPTDEVNPGWSPDGSRIFFSSNRKGPRDIYLKAATGAGEAEPLLESGMQKGVFDWSPDGRFILFSEQGAYWALPLEGDRKPVGPLPIGLNPEISPNGRWVAYQSDESGRVEVYVQSFPPSGAKWMVSAAGGGEPHWRSDGRELFYIAGNRLIAVEVKSEAQVFEAAAPQPLFEVRLEALVRRNRYQVASNGQRFLVNVPLETPSSSLITVVVNWSAGLKR